MIAVGSLFAGIGGIELGLEMTGGFKTKWQVEIDPYAQKVLRLRFPEAKLFEDVKQAGKENLEKVDLICGGFPCQDISYAGKGVGIEGERSGLWSEFSRIIREIRPKYVLVENVSALLTRGLGRVLGDLAESGYDAEWDCLPAAAFGAPHRRNRLFIIAYTERNGIDRYVVNSGETTRGTEDKRFRGTYWEQFKLVDREVAPGQWTPTGQESDTRPLLLRNDNGVSSQVDRLKCLGNAVVPQIAFWIGQQILRVENEL